MSTTYQFDTPGLQVENGKFVIRDLSLAEFGAKEVALAEREMPALMAIRQKYEASQPLAGARILGSIHMTVQTAVLVDTLIALGAKVSWTSCNIFSTQDHAAAYLVDKGVSVFAWKGQTNEDSERCLHAQIEALHSPNMILDDGGDLTQLILNEYPDLAGYIYGVSEETTTGVHRLLKLLEDGQLNFPAINVNDSVTKSMVDNVYGCQHSLNDAIKRGTDALLLGKRALVIGYGNVGKGSALSLKQEGMLVSVTEIDPICGVQACLNGYELVNPYNADGSVKADLLAKYDVVVTTTGNVNVCDKAILDALSSNCIVCNIGHFDNEIDTQHLRDNYDWLEIKPQVHKVIDRSNPERYLILLSEGRLVNLGNATGHPSAIMSFSFANQVLAQIHLYQQGLAHKNVGTVPAVTVEVLPKHLDEEVARLSLSLFKGELVTLTQKQADYIDVPVEGPYKPDTYRY